MKVTLICAFVILVFIVLGQAAMYEKTRRDLSHAEILVVILAFTGLLIPKQS